MYLMVWAKFVCLLVWEQDLDLRLCVISYCLLGTICAGARFVVEVPLKILTELRLRYLYSSGKICIYVESI